MLVIDSSAIIAVLLDEPEADHFTNAMGQGRCAISAVTVLEAEVVILRRVGPERVSEVRLLLNSVRTAIHPFDDAQAQVAVQAYERFGKGRHPARLGLLDCAAYALAKSLDAPLLYKGHDFAQTDIVSAVI